jgi:hypothetical protein
MGCPFLQPKAFGNSGMLDTTPFARACAGRMGIGLRHHAQVLVSGVRAPGLRIGYEEFLLRRKPV